MHWTAPLRTSPAARIIRRSATVHLTDYKVRVINSKDETAAQVRVIIECRRERADGTKEIFGTIGVSGNIIDASWQALVDAYECHLIHCQEESAASNPPIPI